MNYKQEGIALIQILLISALLSVFVIYMTVTARQQVSYALLADDHMSASISLQDIKAWTQFRLLTKQPVDSTLGKMAERQTEWYYDQELFGNSTNQSLSVKIQDLSGLLYPLMSPPEHLVGTLQFLGIPAIDAERMVDVLLDWQDADTLSRAHGAEGRAYDIGPRNMSAVFLEDLLWSEGFDEMSLRHFRQFVTSVPVAGFNPLVSPTILISALYPEEAETIVQLRNQNQLTISAFQRLTGTVTSEAVRFFPSNRYRIRLMANQGDVVLTNEEVIEVSSYINGGIPLKVFYSRWNVSN